MTEKDYAVYRYLEKVAEENANALLKALDRLGCEWYIFKKLTEFNGWDRYKNYTCYAPSIWLSGRISIEYCGLSFYRNKGREIVEFDEIDLEN